MCSKDDSEKRIIGPCLPPHLLNQLNQEENSSNDTKSDNDEVFGPKLPPHLTKPFNNIDKKENNEDEEDDDNVYGPLPQGTSTTSKIQLDLEKRAIQIKLDKFQPNDEKIKTREEWMLELPDIKKYPLQNRKFRTKEGPDFNQRSGWTDTPGKKTEEPQTSKIHEKIKIKKRDEEQEKIFKKKRKSEKSLLDLHTEKQKKKKKEETTLKTERKPFNRETDLQVNRFDEAQKKAILKKAQGLNNRFSQGEAKFL